MKRVDKNTIEFTTEELRNIIIALSHGAQRMTDMGIDELAKQYKEIAKELRNIHE